jgi:hypothetical protein
MITESKQKYNSLHLLQKINDIESGNKKNREILSSLKNETQ